MVAPRSALFSAQSLPRARRQSSGNRQTQPKPLGLGSDKRLEQTLQQVDGIRFQSPESRSGCCSGIGIGDQRQSPIQPPRGVHRLAGIDDQVQQHLLELHRHQAPAEIPAEGGRGDLSGNQLRVSQLENFRQELPDIHRLKVSIAPLEQGPQASDDLGGALVLGGDVCQNRVEFVQVGRLPLEEPSSGLALLEIEVSG